MKQWKPILGLTVCGALVVAAAMGLPALARANLEKDQGVVYTKQIDTSGGGSYRTISTLNDTDDARTSSAEAEGPVVRALSEAERAPYAKIAREALARELGFEIPGDYVCTASGVEDQVRVFFSPKGTLSEKNDALIGQEDPAVVVYQAMFGAADTQKGTGDLNTLQRLNLGNAISKNVLSMSPTLTEKDIEFYEEKARAYAQKQDAKLGARLEAMPVSGSFDIGAMITFEDNAGGTMTYLVSQAGEITGYSKITPKG